MLESIEKEKLLNLTTDLIKFKSVTPNQAGCMDFIHTYLGKTGFKITRLDKNNTSNLVAVFGDTTQPIFSFAGHIDVVPAGDINKWDTDPFTLEEKNGILYGRGISDMKGAIASFIIATEKIIKKCDATKCAIMILLTSDEEGPATDGTKVIVEYLKHNNIKIDYCLLGEPTTVSTLGDTIKIGRRGSLTGHAEIIGQQGHVAYPQLCENPIHKFAGALYELSNTTWDNGNEFFPATSFQFTNLNSGIGVDNVIPGNLHARFNFRYNNLHTADELQQKVVAILDKHELQYNMSWSNSAKPFFTPKGRLSTVCEYSINHVMNITPDFKTDGGTSDGRFLIEVCDEILELGLSNKYIHQISERINKNDLYNLSNIYYTILTKMFE